jgi:hypothetical protein
MIYIILFTWHTKTFVIWYKYMMIYACLASWILVGFNFGRLCRGSDLVHVSFADISISLFFYKLNEEKITSNPILLQPALHWSSQWSSSIWNHHFFYISCGNSFYECINFTFCAYRRLQIIWYSLLNKTLYVLLKKY